MEELKQELIEKIRNTQNINMLLVVKEDIAFNEMISIENGLGLSKEEYDELKMLAEEADAKDTIGFDEFKNTL
jgi:hypothetical protein